MKASDLKGLAVINLATAEKTGTIDDLWLDLATHRVVAFEIKPVKGQDVTQIMLTQVQSLGRDALTYRDAPATVAANQAAAGYAAAPLESASDRPTGPTKVAFSKFINHEKLVTDTGKLLGIVKDVVIDPSTLAITTYEVSEGGLFAKTHQVPAGSGITFGPQIGIVPQNQLPGGEQPNVR